MADIVWVCPCGCRYTAGAVCCPECRRTAHTEVPLAAPEPPAPAVEESPADDGTPEAVTEAPAPAVPPRLPPRTM